MTKDERERREARARTVIGLILVGIMVLSTAGYAFYNISKKEIEKIKYKEIEFFLNDDGLWHFNIQGNDFFTVYNPKDTENISSSISLNLQNYVGNVLYFSYDSEREGIEEVIRNIGKFVSRTQFVCLDECEEDLPVKNCNENIVVIKELEMGESLIRQEDNCVYILARNAEITRASDAFIFRILEI